MLNQYNAEYTQYNPKLNLYTITKSSKKETIIVVHGTFSAKKEDCSNWYAPEQLFCKLLDKELAFNRSGARCWKHLNPGEDFFHWDGRNDWLSRHTASDRLKHIIQRLIDHGWVVHLVGHSHGGNVIMDAIMDRDRCVESWYKGRVVLLGTPIYKDLASYESRLEYQLLLWIVVSLFCWFFLTLYSVSNTNVAAIFNDETTVTFRYGMFIATVASLATFFLLYHAIKYATSNFYAISRFFLLLQIRWEIMENDQKPFTPVEGKIRDSPCFMIINSRFDEAYKSLSELRQSPSPFIPNSGTGSINENISVMQKLKIAIFWNCNRLGVIINSLCNNFEAKVINTLNISNFWSMILIGTLLILAEVLWGQRTSLALSMQLSISNQSLVYITVVTIVLLLSCFFRKVFGSAFLLPGLVVTNLPLAIFKFTQASLFLISENFIKNKVWEFIKSFSLGINGAPRKTKDILVDIKLAEQIFVELPMEIIDKVKLSQKPLLTDIQELLYKDEIMWSPVALKDELIKLDFPMVHTVYYRETTCIKKMANWICEPLTQFWDQCTPSEIEYPKAGENDPEEILYKGFKKYGRNHYQSHVDDLKKRYSTWESTEQGL
ncbi:MAG: alpha/beta hydrolase [Methylococcaceae bacterium]|nr:alpha/beta hydrolase [Methylococcaceae bacterium]MDP3391590.1 alpha/beta hydrolase [Methylococcaceae bacterium]MDP3934090.1 alpha/beta hydrolase [Methylococcaceae bacterium]